MKNQKDCTNHKGFTLVELIVVIVILAILAAILIPGLLKWIDHAKKKRYELEARNIYLATEASLAEVHGLGFESTPSQDVTGIEGDFYTFKDWEWNPNWFIYVKEMSGINTISFIRCYIANGKMKALAIEYTSSDGNVIRATIREGDYGDENNDGNPTGGKGMDDNWKWSADGSWNIEVLPES